MAKQTVAECHPEHLLAESKFLLTESLQGKSRYFDFDFFVEIP